MKARSTKFATRFVAVVLAAGTLATSPVPAMAQDSEARLRKIEAEIRALQRNVFQNGESQLFEPQISSDGSNTSTTTTTNPASTTAVTDILARLDAIEIQLQRLTAVSEETNNSLSLLDTRVAALEGGGTAVAASSDTSSVADLVPTADTTSDTTPDLALAPSADATGATQTVDPAPTGPSAERVAGVQAIAKPQSDDAGDDEYSYGFRLWNAGYYPEARQALSNFVESYPSHWRTTYGRNLLGRAFLDDGMAEEAARWFLRNYQADKQAARAPDSLLFLAESMIVLEDTRRACIALAEFGETYPAVAGGRLSSRFETNSGKVTCAE